MKELEKLRKEIDCLDEKMLSLLAKRFRVTRKIGLLKKESSLEPQDNQREIEIIQKMTHLGQKLEIEPIFVQKFFFLIFQQVIEEHRKIRSNH